MNILDLIRSTSLAAVRQTRRPYRYITGDHSCLGYVRLMFVTNVAMDAAAVVAYARDGILKQVGWTTFGLAFTLLATGPVCLRAAAVNDRTPLGPVPVEGIPQSVLTGMTPVIIGFSTWHLLWDVILPFKTVNPPVGNVIEWIAAYPFVLGLWGCYDRDGGKGERTLTRDLRRLTARLRTPAIAPATNPT